jgi:hypothetical protein
MVPSLRTLDTEVLPSPVGGKSLPGAAEVGMDGDACRKDVRKYVEEHSPRPTVDGDEVDRYLEEAPPAEAADEVRRMVEGFRGGGGAATGKRSEPVPEPPPYEEPGCDL